MQSEREYLKMDFKEIKHEFGDCDWMRVFLNGYAVDAVLWLMNRIEELELQLQREKEHSTEFGEMMDRLEIR